VATNNGPSDVSGATLTFPLPAGISSATWTCTAAGGATCPAPSGSGAINATVNLPAGGSLTYTIAANISAGQSGPLSTTATITAPAGLTETNLGNNSAIDTDNATVTADLAVTKTNGVTSVTPGTNTTYTIVVTNSGPSNVTGASVIDTLPVAISSATWTCAASAGSSCAAASGSGSINTTVNLLSGGTATFTVVATVSSGATGTLNNTVTVAVPAGAVDPVPGNNTAADNDTLIPTVDLAITNTDGVTTAVPGNNLTYTVVATNNGPGAANGAMISYPLPSTLKNVAWTCVGAGGAICPATNGTGSINHTANLPSGGTLTYTVTAMVAANATGTLTTTAAITAPSGVVETSTSNNSATDTDTLTPQADLAITKTDGATTAIPGKTTTYTIVVTNNGPSAVSNALVTDTLPASIGSASWTCVASAGSNCDAANGAGNINATVDLAPGGTATFTLTATVAANATGTLTNTASVAAPTGVTDSTAGNNSATDTDTLTPQADLAITKTNGVTSVAAGGATTYTIVVTNNGPSAVTGANISDTFAAAISSASWTCVASGGSSCGQAGGSGSIATTVNLASGGTATFTVTAQISGSATGNLSNTASVAVPAGVTDPTAGNNSATDGPDTINPQTDLAIIKTGPANASPGGPISYAITVINNGPGAVTGANVTDTFSNQLTNVGWTCTASGGSNCASASGTGNIATTVNLLNGGSATFIVTATVSSGASGAITNVASVAAPSGVSDPNFNNNSNQPVVTLVGPGVDLAITKSHTGNFQVGQKGVYKLTVENQSQISTSGLITVTDALPIGLTYVSATGQGWTCSATGQTVTCTRTAPLVSGAISEITLTVFVTDKAFPSVVNTASVSTPGDSLLPSANSGGFDVDKTTRKAVAAAPEGTPGNNVAYDQTIVENGLGIVGNPYPAISPVSGQKTGSILVFPIYTSDAVNSNVQNTRIALTNSDPVRPISVHLFFVDGSSCAVADTFICLTANQTTSFLASDIDPGSTGYVIAVAVNEQGCPIIFNQLLGDLYVKFLTGHEANLAAEAISALPGLLDLACSPSGGSVTVKFDDLMYGSLPRVLALSNVLSRADGNDTLLIVNRIGGNLGTGVGSLGTLFGLLYDDAESALSFSINSGSCQYRGSITNNAPRTAPRFETFIPAGRSGWMRLYGGTDVGILGAAINRNSNASSSAGAFNQGHNLHTLTLTNSVTATLPVFPPSCQ